MKNLKSHWFLLIAVATLFPAAGMNAQKSTKKPENPAKIEVIYFHYTRRCLTCNAVEAETLKALETLYQSQYKSGKITFKSVNLDEKDSKAIAEKCKAEGQALIIISGKKRFDLTETGFMYARSNPEKLKAELKKAIDFLL